MSARAMNASETFYNKLLKKLRNTSAEQDQLPSSEKPLPKDIEVRLMTFDKITDSQYEDEELEEKKLLPLRISPTELPNTLKLLDSNL